MTIAKSVLTLLASLILIVLVALHRSATSVNAATESTRPQYTSDGQMKFPDDYRQWVYVTTGLDMSYNPALKMNAGHHMFDNVFVNPEAYQAFIESGNWPDKTVLVLEGRKGEDKGSINKQGSYQGTEVMGVEVHVKDESRFPGKWAFFIFDSEKTAKMVPADMSCYSCHAEHAAVDTTFVQFYPTLLPVAQSKGTLSPEYKKESATK